MSPTSIPDSVPVCGNAGFPIVALGASAGGLRSLNAFFNAVPETSGMAYLVVVHMAPDQRSMMAELLGKVSRIPVATAADGQTVEPDHAYVIPPDREMTVYRGQIQLMKVVKRGADFLVDALFRSLAQDVGKRAVAVVLSGTGTDGTQGIREIKAAEGLALAESESSAEYGGMPRAAAETGLVDMILPPEEMPTKIGAFFAGLQSGAKAKPAAPSEKEQARLNKIFSILRANTRHDFSAYKVNTLRRRINRRMSLNQIHTMETYLRHLRENPDEVQALFQELLIGVTHFFREPAAFEMLKTSLLPEQLAQLKEDETFRIWIPGCSTGEEVYSLAMILHECLEQTGPRINLQLFGTDIDGRAIEKARQGLYPRGIEADVDEGRLKRFFRRQGEFYQIRKEVRENVIFSLQNVYSDPPFLRLNLLCCRNLLIYLNADAQNKILPLFHYALRPGGLLMLGASESIGPHANLFEAPDPKSKIFRRKETPYPIRQRLVFPSGIPKVEAGPGEALPAPALPPPPDISELTRQAVLDQFAPTAVLVDAKGEIRHVQGRSGKYLEATSGPPTQNILELAREGLRIELSSALRAARSSGKPVLRREVAVQTNGEVQRINLHVRPQLAPKTLAGHYLVAFEDLRREPLEPAASEAAPMESEGARISELERELQITRESHQSTIEELESSNEELKSTNEEMQSSNEELQSINEELESSKEELHSLNEELQTVNSELQSKVDELTAAQDDLRNLLNGTQIATIFVDNEMRLRRFTAQATRLIHLIETDVGRPLRHLTTNLDYDGMISDVAEVLDSLAPRDREVRTREGVWYNMCVMPYRTMDNRIDGAVVTFFSIDGQKQAQERLKETIRQIEQAGELVRAIFDMNEEPMAALNGEGKIVAGNKAFAELFGENPEDLIGIDLLAPGTEKQKQFSRKIDLKKMLAAHGNFQAGPLRLPTAEGETSFFIRGRVIHPGDEAFPYRILLQFQKARPKGEN